MHVLKTANGILCNRADREQNVPPVNSGYMMEKRYPGGKRYTMMEKYQAGEGRKAA